MKRIVVILCLLSSILELNAQIKIEPFTPETQQALIYGADVKLAIKVIDDIGNPVTNADVNVCFVINGKWKDETVRSNHAGEVVVEGRCDGEIVYGVSKKGYYNTNGRWNLAGTMQKRGIVKNGKWETNPYIIVLMPKRNQHRMMKYIFEAPPPKAQIFGFDLLIGDYVEPYGDGKINDFLISYTEGDRDGTCSINRTVKLSWIKNYEGVYMGSQKPVGREMHSERPFPYHASTNDIYKNEIIFNKDTRVWENRVDTFPNETNYLILRTRTKIDKNGDLIEAKYAILPWEFEVREGHISFYVYINIKPNDINLEWDEKEPDEKRPLRLHQNKPPRPKLNALFQR